MDRRTELDTDLNLTRVSCPIGVLLIIFEARPEVIANIASLAIKSGNAAILKGGKESTESFTTIAHIVSDALSGTAVPNDAIQLVTTRDAIEPLLSLDRYIDLVIPRGGNELVRWVKRNTQIPVLGHADGLCSIYLRADVDSKLATRVVVDAKTSYPAACNAVETLLVDENALNGVFTTVAKGLLNKSVQLRCDAASLQAIKPHLSESELQRVTSSTDADYRTEFLDLILAVKTIPTQESEHQSADEAIDHINTHSSHHTDVILTEDAAIAEYFLDSVDSAGVFWNTSSRMADGQRFGFGTEVGISTNKIHARGPVGLEGLTIYKWLLRGTGQVSAEYGACEGGKTWKHRHLLAGDEERVARDAEELEVLREHRRRKEAMSKFS